MGSVDTEVGIKILQHLPQEAVDRAAALVGDDEVEGLDGDGGIVSHVLRADVGASDLVAGLFVGVLWQLLAAQHGVDVLAGLLFGEIGHAGVFLSKQGVLLRASHLQMRDEKTAARSDCVLAATPQNREPVGLGWVFRPCENLRISGRSFKGNRGCQ